MKYVSAMTDGKTAKLTLSNESLQGGSTGSASLQKPQRIAVVISSKSDKVTIAMRPNVMAAERKRELANRSAMNGFVVTEFSTGDI